MPDIPVPPAPAPAFTTLAMIERNLVEQGGVLTAGYTRGEWTIQILFGEEEPGSDMAGGAAYGIAPTLIEALDRALAETGWR